MKFFDWFKCLFTKKCDDKIEICERATDVKLEDVTFVDDDDVVIENVIEQEVEEKTRVDDETSDDVEVKTTIEKYAHKNDKKLTEFTIDSNVEKIELSAFYGCTNLKKVYVKTNFVPELGKTVFQYRKDNKTEILPDLTIYVDENLIEDFKNDKMWSKYADNIEPII